MSLHEHIDIYCERTGPEFWSEPVNAVTNLSFVIAAYLAYRLWKRTPQPRNAAVLALIVVGALVGIGSFLFHTVATKLAMLADIFPIIIFIHLGFGLILHRIFGFGRINAVLGVLAFVGFNYAVRGVIPFSFMNGSAQYLPALVMLAIVAGIMAVRKISQAKNFAIAAAVFLLSVFFRSTDMESCATFPIGTHFMWHVLNGIVIYYVLRGIILAGRK